MASKRMAGAKNAKKSLVMPKSCTSVKCGTITSTELSGLNESGGSSTMRRLQPVF